MPRRLNFGDGDVDLMLENSDPQIDPRREPPRRCGEEYGWVENAIWVDDRTQMDHRDILVAYLNDAAQDGGRASPAVLEIMRGITRRADDDEDVVCVYEAMDYLDWMTPSELKLVGDDFARNVMDSRSAENLLNIVLLERYADGPADAPFPAFISLDHFYRSRRQNHRYSASKPPRGCHTLKQLALALAPHLAS